jgi:hypothetical protein
LGFVGGIPLCLPEQIVNDDSGVRFGRMIFHKRSSWESGELLIFGEIIRKIPVPNADLTDHLVLFPYPKQRNPRAIPWIDL